MVRLILMKDFQNMNTRKRRKDVIQENLRNIKTHICSTNRDFHGQQK